MNSKKYKPAYVVVDIGTTLSTFASFYHFPLTKFATVSIWWPMNNILRWDPQCLHNVWKFSEFKIKSLFNEAVFSQIHFKLITL
jgi:hypothetical protein